ncbi:MAG: hypothetical protein JKY48_09030 [Flavobacteriales bacterium]|nr:hypothetical protein [Flavobacteriales bacterium]
MENKAIASKEQLVTVESMEQDTNNQNISSQVMPQHLLHTMDSLPKEINRPKYHHLITFKRPKGTNANGFRLRYTGFSRDWNDFDWKPTLSTEIEFFSLNKEFSDFSPFYSYIAIGLGTIKPLNNYFFLDLNVKVGFGSESIDRGLFVEQERNSIIGLFLTQRIHFIIGQKFGLVLSAGIYENFFSGAEYLNSDLGVLIGGGLKF